MTIAQVSMVFTCIFCALIHGSARRDGSGKCKLTNDNVLPAITLLKQQHPEHTALADQITVGKDSHLCLECFPENLRAQVRARPPAAPTRVC